MIKPLIRISRTKTTDPAENPARQQTLPSFHTVWSCFGQPQFHRIMAIMRDAKQANDKDDPAGWPVRHPAASP